MKNLKRLFALLLVTILATASVVFALPNPDEPPELYNLRWNRYTARWQIDGYAEKYQVALFRDYKHVTTKSTTSKSFNFVNQMKRGSHEYYFEVRAYNKYYGWTSWEQSDTTYISDDPYDPYDPYAPTVSPTISPYGPGGGGPVVPPSPVYPPSQNVPEPQIIPQPAGMANIPGTWISNGNGWYFIYSPSNTYATNTWLQSNGHWYYFQMSGLMATGFITLNGKTFYLNPDGTMATGMLMLNGITHFFDANGVMVY